MKLATVFKPNYERYEGVRPFKIYLLRLLYFLVFIFVGYDSWTYIFNFDGQGDHVRAAAFCMWASYSLLSGIGVVYPLKMLPIVAFEILYKVVWLLIIAYPLWSASQLAGSPAEGMTSAFLWVVLPIIAMPWKFTFYTYVLNRPLQSEKSRV